MSLETMTKLASTTVDASAPTTVTFSNIPQGYTDLRLVCSSRTNKTGQYDDYVQLSFNGTTSLQTAKLIYAVNGTSVGSQTISSIYSPTSADGASSSIFGSTDFVISNYSSSKYKTITTEGIGENNASGAVLYFLSGLWSSPAPITSIGMFPQSGSTWKQNSTFTLYGIKNATQTAGNSIKATGGNIVFDGTYVYHAFLSSDTFTPTQPLIADVLVVAGGGGGAGQNTAAGGSGGGGAGGLLGFSNQSLSNGVTYTCTVGAGGAGGSTSTNGIVGSDSQFGSLTTVKGGGSGAKGGSGTAGGAGGSGGGGAYSGGGGTAGGSATSGQGYAGGAGSSYQYSGSGGGAGGVGTSGLNSAGIGSSVYSAWGVATGQGQNVSGTRYFAGGGAGGGGTDTIPGGYGGGGAAGGGSNSINGTSGTSNTGGGGGGGSDTYNYAASTGGSGGSGIIIVRYKG
jgi:hypothetical protein